jgi:alpha-beta hydrolase superfamily lysophospholipase
MDYNIRLYNGLLLKGMIASPGEHIRAIIIMVHGVGEHIKRYQHLSLLLNKNGIGFTGMDLPGHGRSEGSRGHIRSFRLTDEMIDILLNETRKTFPGVPVFIYGHSLGGLIVLDYLLRKNPSVKGVIVTSPWIKLTTEPSEFKVLLASLFSSVLPGFAQASGLSPGDLSHDKTVVDNYIADPLVHDKISAGLFSSAVSAAKKVLLTPANLKIPLLLMHGSEDKICSPEGSREYALLNKSAELRIWEGGYHELHNEPFKDEVFQHILNWIERQKV